MRLIVSSKLTRGPNEVNPSLTFDSSPFVKVSEATSIEFLVSDMIEREMRHAQVEYLSRSRAWQLAELHLPTAQ